MLMGIFIEMFQENEYKLLKLEELAEKTEESWQFV